MMSEMAGEKQLQIFVANIKPIKQGSLNYLFWGDQTVQMSCRVNLSDFPYISALFGLVT